MDAGFGVDKVGVAVAVAVVEVGIGLDWSCAFGFITETC